MPFLDWAGIVLLYPIFCFAGMRVFGTPLVYLYSRLNWDGFFVFIAGGAVCAALTYILVMREHTTYEFPFFTMFGVVEGLVFESENARLTSRIDGKIITSARVSFVMREIAVQGRKAICTRNRLALKSWVR
jgi:hypothetical protein